MSELIVKKNHGVFIYQVDDIVYMEKNRRKICLHNRCSKQSVIEFYGKFEDVLPSLDNRFMYCHRSYIINMDAIVWMCGCEIFIINNQSIHMGRDAYGRARKIFATYLNEKYPEKTLKNAKFFL